MALGYNRPVGELRADQPDSARLPGRKNTRRWCRGKVGREHVLEIVVPENTPRTNGCCSRERTRDGNRKIIWGWWCNHVERCSVCHKVFRWNTWGKTFPCPDRPKDDA